MKKSFVAMLAFAAMSIQAAPQADFTPEGEPLATVKAEQALNQLVKVMRTEVYGGQGQKK